MKKAMFVAVAAIAITVHGAINVTASRDYVDKKVYTLQTNLEERIENAQPGNYSVVSNNAMNALQKTGGTITGGYLNVDGTYGGSGGSVKLTSEAGGPLIEMTRYDGAKWTLGYGWIMWPNGNIIGIPTPTSEVNFAFDTDVSNATNNLAAVAHSGSYGDLSDKPTKLSQFQNDSGFITASMAPVKTVNSKTGNVTLGATDVGAIPMSFGAAEMDPTSSYRYSTGDVMSISGKFYKAEYPFRPSTTPDPIGNEAVEELPDLKSFSEHVLRNSFLPLGYGGTNMPHYKKIDIGYESGNQRRAYLLLDPDGIDIQTRWNGEVFRIRNGKIMYTTTDWSSFYEIDVTKILTRNSVLPFRYNTEDYKDSPTSSYYVYQYLTNNYLTAFGTEEVYLKKSDASTTYLSKTDAASIYDTPDGVKSKISTALQNYRPEYTYREYGTYRTRQDGVMQRKILTSYWNVSFTNLNNGLTMKPVSGWPNKWTCDLGGTSVTVNRTNGVYTCEEHPFITATEDYDGDCVIVFSSPLGVMVADSGTFDWEDYDRYVTDGEITNYYTKAEADAALDRKLDKSGGDMTGPLSVDTSQGSYRVRLGNSLQSDRGDGVWWSQSKDALLGAECGIYSSSLMGDLAFVSAGNEIHLQNRPGTLAFTSDVPDATLTPVYSDWVCEPASYTSGGGVTVPVTVEWNATTETWEPHIGPSTGTGKGDAASTSLSWAAGSEAMIAIAATRTIVGYTLGSQVDKPLQPQGNYAPLASPAFTGTPTAPTPTAQSIDTQVANKKYVDDTISADIPPAVSNVVTTALVRERLGVYLYIGEDGGVYVHTPTNEEEEQ